MYIASSEIGHSVKASLHPRDPARPGREWRVALVGDRANVDADVAAKLDARVIDAWDSESGRLGDRVPLRQGFAVVLGHFSTGRHPRPHNATEQKPADNHLAKVDWIDDLPPDDHRVYRGHLRTTTDALRAFMEVAVTIGDLDGDA